MSATGLAVFDTTVQITNEWLSRIVEELGWGDHALAYDALRGTLHAIRDELPVDEAAHLAAQLPMLIRGLYYEGWDPSSTPIPDRSREAFLDRVEAAFNSGPPVNPRQMAQAAMIVLSQRIDRGQVAQVWNCLPEDVRDLWPVNVNG